MKKFWISGIVAAAVVFVLAGLSTGHAARHVLAPKGFHSPDAFPDAAIDRESSIDFAAATQGAETAVDTDAMTPMGRLANLSATGRLGRALARARARRENTVRGVRTHGQEIGGDDGDDEGEDDDLNNPAGGQAETSIAVDSTGMHIVVGFNDTRGFALNPVSVSGFQYSDDGGATFIDGGQLPVNVGANSIGGTNLPQVFGDPEVKYLGGSTFVYFSIVVKKFSATQTVQTMGVHRSTDFGHTWTGPFEIPPATNPHGATSGGVPRDAADKEYADRDPDTGRVILAWNNFTFASPTQEMSATYSDDLATATPPTWSARVVVSGALSGQNAIIPRFAGGGSPNAYAAWPRGTAGGLFMQFARSTDSGATWAAPVNVTGTHSLIDQILGNDRSHQFPGLAVDNSGGPYQGNIYLAYATNNNHDGSDLAYQRSTDGGLTFSPPILLNSRPGSDRAQWFPWVAVDTSTGRVNIFYLDQGIAANGDLSETTRLFSDDGGVTWSKPMPVSDRPYHAGWGNDTGQPNLGDYNQSVAQNGELFLVWAGTELKGFADGQPSASMTTPDVAFKRNPAVKISVDLGAVTFTDGNGNGFIDAGELVNFKMPLRNYDTNPLHSGNLTAITGTLSTTTPGVSVLTAASAYPNLAPGASATNNTDYVVKTAASFVSGTHIELKLDVSSAEGTNPLLFTQATGAPGTTVLLSENFNGVAAGSLPAGWTTAHGGGDNTVPWTTNNTFFGTGSNAAFHIEANDGPGGTGNPARFERLFSPIFDVPANAEYVTVDMDVAYDTEDEPAFNIQAYDGFLLRVTDQTPGRTVRSVLAEAFEEELFTGALQHYPKHFPRGTSGGRVLEDMSAWAGDSVGFKHVHMKFPGPGGLAGGKAQLRFEYTQDTNGICSDVHPGHTQCGVMFDNLVVQSAASVQADVALWVGVKNSDDVGTNFDLKAEVFRNGVLFGTGQVNYVASGSSGFNNAILRAFSLALSSSNATYGPGDTLSLKVSVRAGTTGHRSGTIRLWFNDSQADSRLTLTVGGTPTNYYLRDGFLLETSPGPGPKKTIDVFVDRLVGGNAFKTFGTWTHTF